jgi:predicted RNA binding protein YcfA (HicA-like mRNA interferase family)
MPASTQQILDILAEHEIEPLGSDPREIEITGEIGENEEVFEISVEDILGEMPEPNPDFGELSEDFDPLEALDDYLREMRGGDETGALRSPLDRSKRSYPVANPPEPFCAWYCPVHYFGADWGIYIREDCTIRQAYEIARHLRFGGRARGSRWKLAEDLIRASFYAFYLHEQFHHKVESFAFRLLVSTRRDCYRPYQSSVYVTNFRTMNCIEESLANADSVRRLNEPRYKDRLSPAVRQALKRYLQHSIPKQPYSYGLGLKFVPEQQHEAGIRELQSQVLTATCPAKFPSHQWLVAKHMIRSAMDIDRRIYAIVPRGVRPVLPWGHIKPAPTTSSRELVQATRKHYGFEEVDGGKGSHIKMKHPDGRTLIIPGNRKTLRPGTLSNTLETLGGFSLRQLPEVLAGRATG